MVYFSRLKGRKIIDSKKKDVGLLDDLIFADGKKYAEVTHIVCVGEDKYKKKIPFTAVEEFKETPGLKEDITIKLNLPISEVTPFFLRERELLVGDILDKQVVDVDGAKVVRVNDVLLGKIENKFCVVAVGVGTSSLLRRSGLGWVTNLAGKTVREHIIPWESIERLEPEWHDLHLKIQKSKITDMHPEDIADVMEDLSRRERFLIFNTLDKETAVKTLIGAEPEVQDSVFRDLKMSRIRDLLEDIPVHQAVDILSMMNKMQAEKILGMMRKDRAVRIRKILGYSPDVAGAIMDTEFIAIPAGYTAQDTIDLLRKLAPESTKIYHLYVVDDEKRLLGVLSIRALLAAPPEMKVADFMKKDVIHVKTKTPKEDIAKAIAKYDLFVLPVVDSENILRGIVTADDVLTEIMPESWRRHHYMPHKIRVKRNKVSS